jgi:hypothetical protein
VCREVDAYSREAGPQRYVVQGAHEVHISSLPSGLFSVLPANPPTWLVCKCSVCRGDMGVALERAQAVFDAMCRSAVRPKFFGMMGGCLGKSRDMGGMVVHGKGGGGGF